MKTFHAAFLLSVFLAHSTLTLAQKTEQNIAFSSIPAKVYGNPTFTLVATASSGLAVSFASSNATIVTISGATVTILGAGEVVITALQGGNNAFNAAPSVGQRIFIQKASQSIAFPTIPMMTYGDPQFIPATTASSNLSITFASSDPAVASIVNGQVVINRAGEVQITAAQLGNGKFFPAISVTQTLTIQKATQTLTFTNLIDKSYGAAPFAITVTASSGDPVDWIRSDYDTVAQVSGNMVTIRKAGGTPIMAYQKGNENFLPVLDGKYFTVYKALQTITFNSLPSKTFGDEPFEVNAIASSGLPITFTSNRKPVASVSGNVVVIHGAGKALIVATQPGNTNYQGVLGIQTLTVNGLGQTYSLTGSARLGGFGGGTLITINSDGTGMTVTERFEPISEARPTGGLLKASDGKLYGVLSLASVMGNGEIFTMNTDGSGYTVLRSLQPGDGRLATGSLIEATDGYLYGVTTFNQTSQGLIYRIKKNGTDFSIVHPFQSVYGPTTGVMQAADGKLYGTAPIGGDIGAGAVYVVNPDGTDYSNTFSFDGPSSGSSPRGVLVQGTDQYLYGGTASGGANDKGIVYKVKPDGTDFTTLVAFDSIQGWGANGSLILASNGKLYGMTEQGGAHNKGVIFSLFPNGSGFAKLLDFDGVNTGATPLGSLVESTNDGYLYGMTNKGGTADLGVSFKVKKDGTGFTKLEDFTGVNGSSPMYGPLLEIDPGLFYGMTSRGGNGDVGLIFSVTSGGTYGLVKEYPQPISKPETLTGNDVDGHYVGITLSGGTTGMGTLFTVEQDGTGFTPLADLPAGQYPNARKLMVASDHSIWGIGLDGPTDFLFRMTSDGASYQRIDMNPAIGVGPVALVESKDGYVYGAASYGGVNNYGTIFRVQLNGTGLSHVLDFPGNADGFIPTQQLIMHSNGSLYGITSFFGGLGAVLYRITPDLTYSKVASLIYEPVDYLLELNGGSMCLATHNTLMIHDPSGEYQESIIVFNTSVGENVQSMLQTVDGYILVALRNGGTTGYGSLIKVLPDGSQYFKILDFEAPEGVGPNSILMRREAQQILSFDDIPQKQFLDPPFALKATTSSGSPVLFTSSDQSVAEVDGYRVTIKGIGATTIRGTIPVNGNFTESASLTRVLTVVKSNQQFTFDAIPDKKYGDPNFRLAASSESGLPISFSSSDMNVATVTNNEVTLVGVGVTTITATIVQDSNFDPAPPIQHTLTIVKKDQVIQLDPIGAHYVDAAPYELSFVNASGLPVTFTSGSPSVATVLGTTVTPVAVGQSVITGNAAADANYNAALPVQRTLSILKYDQVLIWDAIADKPVENGIAEFFPPKSTAGLTVDLTTTATNITLSGSAITMLAAGKVTMKANQAGTNLVNPATEISRTFCILPGKPTITVDNSNPNVPVLTSSVATGNEWLRNGALVTGGNGQSITPTQGGSYTVQVNIEGCISAASNPQVIVIVGLEDEGLALSVYPNPSAHTLYVSLPPTNFEIASAIEVHNQLGVKLSQLTTTQVMAEIDIQTLPTGLYLLRVTREGKSSMVRFIKQ